MESKTRYKKGPDPILRVEFEECLKNWIFACLKKGFSMKKASVRSGTRGGSETSMNAVAHENI